MANMSSSTPWPELPGLRAGADGPVFAEPWQAQAFAMALELHRRGLFEWSEFATALAQQIERCQARGEADTGERYYHHWLAALEELVAAKGASSATDLARARRAWSQAAQRTAHGRPIELRPIDFVD
jgi:nitrile hydratase accessory protein